MFSPEKPSHPSPPPSPSKRSSAPPSPDKRTSVHVSPRRSPKPEIPPVSEIFAPKELTLMNGGEDYLEPENKLIIQSPEKNKRVEKPEEDSDDQPRKKKSKSEFKSKESQCESDSEDLNPPDENMDGEIKSALQHIPDDIRYNPQSLENKPKGLVDALSNFFTPGLKRTSRTALNSLLKPESKTCDKDSPRPEEPKKVRLSVEENEHKDEERKEGEHERKRHASAGQQQVKSLYDGLSHLYSDCDSRLRSVPMTNYNEKGRGENSGPIDPTKAGKSPERISSPHRMSDTELKELEKTGVEKKGGGKEKGNSKKTLLCTVD